jgi:hypothetical protein
VIIICLANHAELRAQSVAPNSPSSSQSGGPLAGPSIPGVRPAQSQPLPAEALPGGRVGPQGVPQAIRWTENWSKLPAKDAPPQERIRHIPLGLEGFYLSLGAELRLYYTSWQHATLGVRPDDSNDPLQTRLRLVADLHLGPYARGFFEFGDSREFGQASRTPPNVDRGDIQQAFVDLTIPLSAAGKISFRPGRFEMPLGNGKLVGIREGVNVRFTYQGLRATYILPGFVSVDAFVVRPMRIQAGPFDDKADSSSSFYGVYVSSPRGILGFGLDAYWYRVNHDSGTLRQGTGADHRDNLGARLWRRTQSVDLDLEFDYQTGRFMENPIRAWGVLVETGYTWAQVAFAPRFGVRANVFSGDGNLNDKTVGTFVAAFPRLPLTSDASFFNLSNLMSVYPMVTLKPWNNVTVLGGPDFLWRQSLADGVYIGPNGSSLPPHPSDRFTGTEFNVAVGWQIAKNFQLGLAETYFSASRSTRRVGGLSSNYLGIQLNCRL